MPGLESTVFVSCSKVLELVSTAIGRPNISKQLEMTLINRKSESGRPTITMATERCSLRLLTVDSHSHSRSGTTTSAAPKNKRENERVQPHRPLYKRWRDIAIICRHFSDWHHQECLSFLPLLGRIDEPSLVSLKPVQSLVTLVLHDRSTQRPCSSDKRCDLGTFLVLLFVLCPGLCGTIVVVTLDISVNVSAVKILLNTLASNV